MATESTEEHGKKQNSPQRRKERREKFQLKKRSSGAG
jgi:hypothetical protein